MNRTTRTVALDTSLETVKSLRKTSPPTRLARNRHDVLPRRAQLVAGDQRAAVARCQRGLRRAHFVPMPQKIRAQRKAKSGVDPPRICR